MCRLTLNIFGVIVIITVCVITAMCTNDNPQCPPGTICKKNICTKEVLCDDDSKCALDESCVGDKGTARCQYVCLGRAICGQNALCTGGIHRKVCYCEPGHTGDPYVQCNPIDYCEVAPCGPGARCRNSRGSYQCTCPPDHVGNAYEEGCRISIECERNTDCGNGSECTTIDDVPKCRDVCANPKCGPNAECVPENHKANCVCRNGYEGNPADWETGCTLPMTCHVTSDCSPNTYCSDRICKLITAMCTNDNPQCPPGTICKKNICTKEVLCDDDSKCALDESCVGDKGTARCQYVCLGRAICGQNALCTGGIHRKVCYCQPGHTGDPYVQCNPIDYCEVAPCGPGARCRNSRGSYQCTCPPDHVGNAYEEGCRISIECERNTDCGNGSECTTIDDVPKCRDVCANPKCGPNAECVPENHKANCVCRNGYEGNPADWETGCTLPMTCHVTSDCSPNTYCSDRICKLITAMCTNDNPQCPPGTICKKNICTKEVLCDDDSKCALDESCVGDKGTARCQYVCLGRAICGQNALCTGGIHRKVCYCEPGHTGDPYVQCNPIDYCEVAPCGPGARCRNSRGSYQCTCPPDHVGNAYEEGCRISIECERNTDCGNGSECTTIDDVPKCRDVCANPKCGPNAECVPENHKANCVCRNGYEGNPADWETGCTLPMTCHVTSDCSPNTYCSDRICKPL